MCLSLIPKKLREKFTFDEREYAVSILAKDFPSEWADILVVCLDLVDG